MRQIRYWAHNVPLGWQLGRGPSLLTRFRCWLGNVFLDYAAWRSRDSHYCWAEAAMWAMGYDGYDLLHGTTRECCYCGKCKPEARDGSKP